MKKNATHHLLITITAVAFLLPLLPLPIHAAIPQTITYQGYLTDPQGTPIDESISIVFSIYSQASEGTALWTETHTVAVTDGVFSSTLGKGNTIALPFDTPYYLGIKVGSDNEMTPRQALTSVAYAFRALEADSVTDNAVTTTIISNNAVTTEKVADDAITGDKIAPATITSTNIANGAVTSTQIGDNTITAEKITPPVISSIDGVTNDGGNVDLVAGTNVTITPDDVANTITITAAGGGVGSNPWTESGGNVYRSAGNVGIGTSDPKNKLEVNGYTVIGSDSKGIRMRTDGFLVDLESLGSALSINHKSGHNTLMNVDGGNVGIGAWSPDQRLTIIGESGNPANIKVNQIGDLNWAGLRLDRENKEQWFIGMGNTTNNLLFRRSANSNDMVINKAGNIGVGIQDPNYRLQVVDGAIVAGTAQKGVALRTNGTYVDLESLNSPLSINNIGQNTLINTQGGRVGIGTNAPQKKVDIDKGDLIVQGVDSCDAVGEEGIIHLGTVHHYIKGVYGHGVKIGTYGVGDVISIRETSGRVGIGTTEPTERLDVNGTMKCNILKITGGSDIAEPFETDRPTTIKSGMVLAIDEKNPGKLKICNQAYDRKVAGIVSGAGGVNPGMLMSQENTLANGLIPVALTGRVYCLADAHFGPIEPGDLLTSSNTPGHAMRVTDYSRAPGATLGKAMTALNDGKGLVLVLATLQ